MNFTDILSEYRIPYREHGAHHHTTAGWLSVDCPRCSPNSGRFRLGFNKNNHYWSCWVCSHLPLTQTLADLIQEPYWKAAELLSGISKPLAINKPLKTRGTLTLPKGLAPMLEHPHRSYLKRRGFDPDYLEAFWGVKGIGLASKLSWRIWLPIHYQGEITSWTTRAVSDNCTSRYINAKPEEELLPAKSLLFGADHIRHAVICCEGPFDAIKIGSGAVATMGISYSRSQALALSKIPIRAICFDSEPNAQIRARKLCEELSAFPGETVCVTLKSKDPGSASHQEIIELRKRFLE